MPRYYQNHPGGYDLDRELPFCDVDGVGRVELASRTGGFLLICRTCLEEQERSELRAWCVGGHGPMEPLTFDLADQLGPTMAARGIKLTTVAYRRRRRLEREAANPDGWVFGTRIEADYPEGYCKAAKLSPCDCAHE
jgi:hypothetical protein